MSIKLHPANSFMQGKKYLVDIGKGELIVAFFVRFTDEFFILIMSDDKGEFPAPIDAIYELPKSNEESRLINHGYM